MKIVLPLPDALTTTFVVAVEQMAFDAGSIVPWRVGDPYRRAAIDAVACGAVTVTAHPVPWKPEAATLTGDERRRLRRTRQHVVVAATAPPHRFPSVAQVARAVARALAREYDGLLIDPLTGSTVLTCGRCATEPPIFNLDDDWASWGIDPHDETTCPDGHPSGAGLCDCPRITSRGLSRFALPEITVDGAVCGHSLCATNLLRTVGSRLVSDHLSYLAAHPEATTRTIDDFLHVPPPDHPTGFPFAVRLTPYDLDTAADPDTCTTTDPSMGPHPDPGVGTHTGTCIGTGSRACAGAGSHPHLLPHPNLQTAVGTDAGELGRAREIRRLMVEPVPGVGQIACLKVGPPPSSSDGSLQGGLCPTRTPPQTPRPLADHHSRALAA